SKLAYLSNRGRDFGATALFVRDLSTGDIASIDLEDRVGTNYAYTCSMGHRLLPVAGGSFSWTPDGKHVIYSRGVDTWEGHAYSDLFRVDVATRKRERLTRGLRAAQPEVSPDG